MWRMDIPAFKIENDVMDKNGIMDAVAVKKEAITREMDEDNGKLFSQTCGVGIQNVAPSVNKCEEYDIPDCKIENNIIDENGILDSVPAVKKEAITREVDEDHWKLFSQTCGVGIQNETPSGTDAVIKCEEYDIPDCKIENDIIDENGILDSVPAVKKEAITREVDEDHWKLFSQTCGVGIQNETPSDSNEVNEKREGRSKCDTCGKSFSTPQYLKFHFRIHSGEKPYKCDTCGKSFSTPQNLKVHFRVHSGEKPCMCDTCGKSFSTPQYLKFHFRIHSGVKPFKCDTCGKFFSTPQNLKTHFRIHSGEKPYKCDTCGKSFSMAQTLKNHFRIHSGKKPYKCDTCGKSFSTPQNLITHFRIHSGEKPYKCDTYGKAFSRLKYLKPHFRVHSLIDDLHTYS